MSRDVVVDGVKYVPETNRSKDINRLSNILDARLPYLLRSEKDKVIEDYKKGWGRSKPSKKVVGKVKPKTKNPQNSLYQYTNFKGFDDEGHILFKSGGKGKTQWTMPQVIEIQQWLNHGRKDKVNSKKLSKRFGMTEAILKRIIYNLEHGELQFWVDRWIATRPKKETPIVNNPQKRKEMGWY